MKWSYSLHNTWLGLFAALCRKVKVDNPWFGVGVTAEVYLLCSNMFFDHVGFFSRCSCNY
jgi:uncharacterized protein (DUF608 family)